MHFNTTSLTIHKSLNGLSKNNIVGGWNLLHLVVPPSLERSKQGHGLDPPGAGLPMEFQSAFECLPTHEWAMEWFDIAKPSLWFWWNTCRLRNGKACSDKIRRSWLVLVIGIPEWVLRYTDCSSAKPAGKWIIVLRMRQENWGWVGSVLFTIVSGSCLIIQAIIWRASNLHQ